MSGSSTSGLDGTASRPYWPDSTLAATSQAGLRPPRRSTEANGADKARRRACTYEATVWARVEDSCPSGPPCGTCGSQSR